MKYFARFGELLLSILLFSGLSGVQASEFGILECTGRKYSHPTGGLYDPRPVQWIAFGLNEVDCAYSLNGKAVAVVERKYEAKWIRAVIASDSETRTVGVEVGGPWVTGVGVSDSGDLYLLTTFRSKFGLLRIRKGDPNNVTFVELEKPTKSDRDRGYCGAIQVLRDQVVVDGRGGRMALVSSDGRVSLTAGERYCPSISHDEKFVGYVRQGRCEVENRTTGDVEFVIAKKGIGRWHPDRDEIIVMDPKN